MRTRLKHKLRLNRFFKNILSFSVLFVFSLLFLKASLPFFNSAKTLGIMSALLVMPEGVSALTQKIPEEPVTEISPENKQPLKETSVDIPFEEPTIPEENKAVLVHKTYTAAPSNIYIPLENGFIKNCTTHTSEEIKNAVSSSRHFKIENTDKPQVLIMHTHTTESYMPFSGDYYDKTYSARSTDNSKNMVAIGEKIKEKIESYGIKVIHDTTKHDYPSYNGAYDRSALTVSEYLKKYPSIKVVLDVHRDAIISGDTATAPVAEINGKTAAQVMIINGCANNNINYPDFFKNLKFAADLENQVEKDYKGLTRPLLFDYRKYNQHLTTGSILLEIGGHANTFSEALYSGELIGDSLGKLLKSYK